MSVFGFIDRPVVERRQEVAFGGRRLGIQNQSLGVTVHRAGVVFLVEQFDAAVVIQFRNEFNVVDWTANHRRVYHLRRRARFQHPGDNLFLLAGIILKLEPDGARGFDVIIRPVRQINAAHGVTRQFQRHGVYAKMTRQAVKQRRASYAVVNSGIENRPDI